MIATLLVAAAVLFALGLNLYALVLPLAVVGAFLWRFPTHQKPNG